MKKVSLFVCSCLLSVGLISCGETPTDYVKFYNYDGKLLWQTEYYPGMILTYGGENPVKPSDDIYEYTFTGWNHSLYDVSTYKNFYAQYSKDFRSFTVSFRNYDNTLLKTASVKYGQNAYDYAPENPTRENEDRTHFRFSHWDGGDLSYVTSDLLCTAIYTKIECFEIQYIDFDGTIINVEYVEKGGDSTYTYSNAREADPNHFYVFSGWDVSVTNVQCDMVVNATYHLVNAYIVTFKNYDGNVLGTSKGPEGFTAQYNGSTPSKPSTTSGDYKYTYTFSGWDRSLENVRNNFETKAQYKTSSYNYRYPEIISELKDYLREHGGYSDGTYSFVFSIDTSSSGFLYTGILQMEGYNGRLSIWLSSVKTDSSGTRATSTRLYLDDYWNNGYFNFSYQFLIKNASGYTTQDDLGSGSMYGPTFNSNATLYFNWYSGTMNEEVAAYNCALMLSISLDKFAKSSTWSMASLGFNNYNY